MVEEGELRGEGGLALHHLLLHVTAPRLPTGVYTWPKSGRGWQEAGQVHGGRPRSLRGCHALAPTPQGQPYQASPQRLFMSSGTGRGCPPTPQPYIWITRSSPCLDKNTTFAPPARFSMQIQLTSLFIAGRAALAKYWRQVCRRLRGSKAVCSPGKSQDSPDLSM